MTHCTPLYDTLIIDFNIDWNISIDFKIDTLIYLKVKKLVSFAHGFCISKNIFSDFVLTLIRFSRNGKLIQSSIILMSVII